MVADEPLEESSSSSRSYSVEGEEYRKLQVSFRACEGGQEGGMEVTSEGRRKRCELAPALVDELTEFSTLDRAPKRHPRSSSIRRTCTPQFRRVSVGVVSFVRVRNETMDRGRGRVSSSCRFRRCRVVVVVVE